MIFGMAIIGLIVGIGYAIVWCIKAPFKWAAERKKRRIRRAKEEFRDWKRSLAESEIEALFGKQGDWSRYEDLR
jgi:hypothetical protein